MTDITTSNIIKQEFFDLFELNRYIPEMTLHDCTMWWECNSKNGRKGVDILYIEIFDTTIPILYGYLDTTKSYISNPRTGITDSLQFYSFFDNHECIRGIRINGVIRNTGELLRLIPEGERF